MTDRDRIQAELLLLWSRSIEEHQLPWELWLEQHSSGACATGAPSRREIEQS